MEKNLSILVTILVVLGVFAFLSNKTTANKNVCDKGTQDELERAKQISLDILRGMAAQRSVGSADDLVVEKVSIDELKMAHTRVRQTICSGK